MKKFLNIYNILGLSFLFLFILLMILLNADKAVIAGSGQPVGLSHINKLVTYSEDKSADKMSDILLYVSFIALFAAGCFGLYQLVRRKSLKRVDIELYAFVVGMAVSVILWLLFDKVLKINVRPLNADEGSFPSTHVFVITFQLLFGHYLLSKYKDDKAVKYGSLVLAVIAIAATALLRVVAGKHYITDICGGLLLGLAIYFLVVGILKVIINKKNEVKTEKNTNEEHE